MARFVSLHICSEHPQALAAFYCRVLQTEPAWSSPNMTGFVLGDVRPEMMAQFDSNR